MDIVKFEKNRRRNTCLKVMGVFYILRAVNVALINTIAESNISLAESFTLWELPFFVLGGFGVLLIGIMYFYYKWGEKRDLTLHPIFGMGLLREKFSMCCGLLTVFFGFYVPIAMVAGGGATGGNVAFLPALVLGFIVFWVLDTNFVKIESE